MLIEKFNSPRQSIANEESRPEEAQFDASSTDQLSNDQK